MSMLSAGLTGLNAAQMGLQTASHNISNASTPSYSRQQVMQIPSVAYGTGAGFIGQGVEVASVRRIYNEFLSSQGLQAQTQSNQLDSYYTQIKLVDNMLGDPNSGLSPALQGFFRVVQDVATNPESVPSRQGLLNSAQAMVARFQSLNQRFAEVRDGLSSQITSSVTEINALAQQIGSLNYNIAQVEGAYGQPANDLLDQRDALLVQLNQQIGATTVRQSDGSVNVFIGTGQALVVGSRVMTLTATTLANDPTKTVVGYVTGGQTSLISDSSLQGGKLGGYLAFRNTTLDGAQNALGRVAIGLAQTFNDQHQLGQDLNGVLGGNFFNVPLPNVIANTANNAASTITASISNVGALTTSDYQFSVDSPVTTYTLTRLSDNTSVTTAILPTAGVPLTLDGISITAATINAGESFTIQPVRNGARDINVAISDTAKIAAAAPIRTTASLSNTGTGQISAGTVNTPLDANLQAPITITFNNSTSYSLTSSNATIAGGTTVTVASTANMVVGAPVTGGGFPAGTTIASITNGTTFVTSAAAVPAAATGQILQVGDYPYVPGGLSLSSATIAGGTNVTVASTAGLVAGAPISGGGFPSGTTIASITNGTTFVTSVAAVPAAATGQTLQVGNTFNGWTAQMTGLPLAGDTFTITTNTGAVADNRNALLLSNLQSQNTLSGGTASYQSSYAQLVSQVGNKTRELEATSKAQATMLVQLQQAQQTVSGVNLDEEAASLLRYQQAYQASGKVLQIASTLFDTLLNLGR